VPNSTPGGRSGPPRRPSPLDANENLRYNESSQNTNRRTGGWVTLYAVHTAGATSGFARMATSSTAPLPAAPRLGGSRIAGPSAGTASSSSSRAARSSCGIGGPERCQQFGPSPPGSSTVVTLATGRCCGEPGTSSSFAPTPVARPSGGAVADSFDGSCGGSRSAVIPMEGSCPFVGLRFPLSALPIRSCDYERTTSRT
jgi:hypothetical protein